MSQPDDPVHPDEAGQAEARAQERVEFLLGLRGRGISDIAVLRAMELAPRENFVPRKHTDLAWRNIALPIACGQTMSEPLLVARMMQALALSPTHRVLEIGAGSGYATAILAHLVREVTSFERYRSLAVEARTRLEGFGIRNATVFWDDGFDAARLAGTFDRILVHGLLPDGAYGLDAALAPDGLMVCAIARDEGIHLVRLSRVAGGFEETIVAPCRMGALAHGRSVVL